MYALSRIVSSSLLTFFYDILFVVLVYWLDLKSLKSYWNSTSQFLIYSVYAFFFFFLDTRCIIRNPDSYFSKNVLLLFLLLLLSLWLSSSLISLRTWISFVCFILRLCSSQEHLFKLNNKNTRTTSVNTLLVSWSLTFDHLPILRVYFKILALQLVFWSLLSQVNSVSIQKFIHYCIDL